MNKFLVYGLLLSTPSAAFAQTTPRDTARQLDEVIVTADKTAGKLSQTGKVVDVITREQLARSGAKSLAQVLGEQPGIIVAGAGSNPGSAKSIYMEGASNGYTLIMVDGVPLQDASSIDNSFDLRSLTLEDIDHIEIVKGSQSVLYGSDAIAGVINIITRKGADKPIAIAAQGSVGYYNTHQVNASVGGKMGTFSYNAGYAFFHTDGISEATDTVPGVKAPADGYTQHSFHVNLDWQATKGLSVSPFIIFSHYAGREDGGSFTIDTSYIYTLSNVQAGLRSLVKAGAGELHLVYSYNQARRTDYDDSLPNLAAKGFFSSDAFGGYEHFAEAYISYPLTSRWNLVGGIDYRNLSTEQQAQYIYSGAPPSPSSLPRDSAHYHQIGFYASTTLKLPGNVYLDGGVRYNTNSKYGSSTVFNLSPSVLIARRLKVFTNFASGYKLPSLYQLYSPYGNRDLAPAKSLSFEGGAEYRTDVFRLRATFFDRWIRNEIFFASIAVPPYGQYINQNKEHAHGVELEGQWNILRGLQLTANYTYVTGTVTDKSGENGADSTYFGLYRVPKNSAGFTLSYQATPHFLVSTNLQWQDKRIDLYYDNNTYADAQATLHAYTLWNAYAEYHVPHWRLKFFTDIRNITNTHFTEMYGYNTLGFTLTGGVRFSL